MTFTDLHSTNWLGTNLVFYNEITGIYSTVFSEVLAKSNLELDLSELNNYFKYGFSFFGRTPIKNIRYTLPNTILRKYSDGRIEEIQQEDPMEKLIGKRTDEQSVHEKIEEWMTIFYAQNLSKQIILPLSGGLDSRLLAFHSKNQHNVNAFTYGISRNQAQSSEVAIAKQVAEKCGIRWNQVILGDFHHFLAENNHLYGVSTHAHSMYHLEFYKGILEHLGNIQSGTVLSGIYGDVWAGSWSFPDIRDPSDVRKLAVTHGMVGSKSRFYDPLLVSESEEIYFQLKAEKLKEPIFRVLEASRLKAVLNRHLIATPNHFSLAVESPFLEIDIVSGMLNLDPERRNRREWQRDYLDKMLPLTRKKIRNPMIHNVSDLQATLQVPVPEMSITGNSPVELRLLNVDEINKYIKVGRIYYLTMLLFSLPFISKFKPSLKRLNFRQNYANYMTTFPIFIQFGKVTS